jgi:hypothetical protein
MAHLIWGAGGGKPAVVPVVTLVALGTATEVVILREHSVLLS